MNEGGGGGGGRRMKEDHHHQQQQQQEYQDRQYHILIGLENSRPFLVFLIGHIIY